MDGEITGEELQELIESGENVRIVDIRDSGSFARGHIPGSENIPFAEIPRRVQELDGAEHVVTVCPIGQSSIQAARLIGSYEGVSGDVESLAEGLDGWEYELATGRGDESGSDGQATAGADEGPEAPF